MSQFERSWSQYWDGAYDHPVPENWDDVNDYGDFLDDYRLRVYRAVRWQACQGRCGPPSNSLARFNRIAALKDRHMEDIAYLKAIGADLNTPITTSYTDPIRPSTSDTSGSVTGRNESRRCY
ncbi:hypothetical protein NMY22_g14022 [Coprinellus aureogranulatus]|nr:hypothetical protein NMY22_g14022 [Coprinellus aureogranulatus]